MANRLKMVGAALLAGLTICVVTAGSASAAEWKVSGVALKGSAALATTARVATDVVFKVVGPGTTIKVLCTGGLFRGTAPEINATNKGMASSLTFESCSTVEPATKCAIEGQPVSIKTNPVTLEVKTGTAPDDKVLVTPLTKNTFAAVPFSGTNTCAINETEPINGSFILNVPFGQTESAAQAVEAQGSSENNSLEAAGDKIYIEGAKALLQLASGSKWSFS